MVAGISVPDFPASFGGLLLRPGSVAFERARVVFNMRNAGLPAAIARCTTDDDVLTTMRYAAERGLPLAVRSGGHGVDASAMPEGALVADLSLMKTCSLDRITKRIRVGSGVLLSELDATTQDHGLVVPAGTVSTTGIAGLVLGGGVGYNMRRYGASVDSLVSCDVVTSGGRLVRASANENPDLFWALRGGGGNFGVVTSFEFQAHESPPEVISGMILYQAEQAAEVLQKVCDYMPTATRELAVIVAFSQCPPLPTVPQGAWGAPIMILDVVYTGPKDVADRVLQPLMRAGSPVATMVGPTPWVVANSMLDAISNYGGRCFTRGGYLKQLSDTAVKAVIDSWLAGPGTKTPGALTVQNLWFMGAGAIGEDFAEDSCAFSREGVDWFWEGVSMWTDPSEDEAFETWARSAHDRVRPHLRANGYVNLTLDQGPDWLRGLYGSEAKFERLLDAKRRWDPMNILRFNKNFKPE
jgi:FAD/FMN-containing dehydrogenase